MAAARNDSKDSEVWRLVCEVVMKAMLRCSLRGHFVLFYGKTPSSRFSGGFWKFLLKTFPTWRGDEALAISEGGVKPVVRNFYNSGGKTDRTVDRLFTKESNVSVRGELT
jgi:hypothetical protein